MSTKKKPPTKLAQPVAKSPIRSSIKSRVDESRAAVSNAEPIEISSDSESGYDASDTNEEDGEGDASGAAGGKEEGAPRQLQTPASESNAPPTIAKQSISADTEMLSPPAEREGESGADDEEPTSPTFGDMMRAHHEAIDVPASLAAQHSNQLTKSTPTGRSLAPPSLSSLGTVLTQALRTDDTDLLESCLQTTDLNTVRNTIQRLDSSLAGVLLSKLASRMHRRPGRAHTLLLWVQWTLISHGGALANQTDLMKKLKDLNQVLEERSRGLNSLLILKGKLDMLEAQMQLRRGNRKRRPHDEDGDEAGSDEEEGIVYVEGEEVPSGRGGLANGVDVEGDDYIAAADGVEGDSEEETDDDEDDAEEEVIDDSMDDDEVDFDDIEESGEEDDSDVEAAAPPAKVQKMKSPFSKRR